MHPSYAFPTYFPPCLPPLRSCQRRTHFAALPVTSPVEAPDQIKYQLLCEESPAGSLPRYQRLAGCLLWMLALWRCSRRQKHRTKQNRGADLLTLAEWNTDILTGLLFRSDLRVWSVVGFPASGFKHGSKAMWGGGGAGALTMEERRIMLKGITCS